MIIRACFLFILWMILLILICQLLSLTGSFARTWSIAFSVLRVSTRILVQSWGEKFIYRLNCCVTRNVLKQSVYRLSARHSCRRFRRILSTAHRFERLRIKVTIWKPIWLLSRGRLCEILTPKFLRNTCQPLRIGELIFVALHLLVIIIWSSFIKFKINLVFVASIPKIINKLNQKRNVTLWLQ